MSKKREIEIMAIDDGISLNSMAHPVNKTNKRPRINKDSLETAEIEIKLTPQQELFCQNYIAYKYNASEAYRQSYNCTKASDNTIWTDAYKLLQKPYVAHRIQELQAEHAERCKVTVESITDELNEAKAFAMQLDNPAATISAIMGKAKIHGLDKLIVEGDIKMVKVINMTGKTDKLK